MTDTSTDLAMIEAECERIRDSYLRPTGQRPASTARGLHHTALISSGVEGTIRFYQELLGLSLDRANREPRLPRFVTLFLRHRARQPARVLRLPGLDVGPYAEVLGGLHHVAISVEPAHWEAIVRRLEEAGVEHVIHSDVSVYFRDPDGARIELIADPLGEMYGIQVL